MPIPNQAAIAEGVESIRQARKVKRCSRLQTTVGGENRSSKHNPLVGGSSPSSPTYGGVMKHCLCGNRIPRSIVIDCVRRNLKNRTRCLTCVPFKTSVYRGKSKDEARSKNAIKARQYYHRKKQELGIDPISLLRNCRREFILSLVNSKCQFCGCCRLTKNLAFHHLNHKEVSLSAREFQKNFNDIFQELLKCVVCCHNCHGEIHHDLISSETISSRHDNFRQELLKISANCWRDLKL